MNEDIILSMASPYVKDGAITYDEFDKIFSFLSRKEQYAVTEILYKKGINLVDSHVKEEAIILDVDDDVSCDDDFSDDFDILYDDTIFKDERADSTYSEGLIVHDTVYQSNEILCHLIQQGNNQATQD